jgi:uncharacterized protein (TIGR04222 family)
VNPLDWDGPSFLAFHIVAMAVAFAIQALLSFYYVPRPFDGASARILESLDPYEIAYLGGGAQAAVLAAIAALVHRGRVKVDKDRIVATDVGPDRVLVADGVYRGVTRETPDHPLETSVLSFASHGVSSGDVVRSVSPAAAALERSLIDRALLLGPTALQLRRFVAHLPLFPLIVLGVAKIVIGLEREKPVIFLVLLVLVTAAGFAFRVKDRRTGRGREVLELLRERNTALEATARSAPQQLSDHEVALASGLFGAAIFGAAAYAPLAAFGLLARDLHPTPTSFVHDSGTSSASSSCGGASCGGSSCGGGCGGGGCGGCGS